MTEINKAVFLSYASEDAVAARRICEALRSAGIEVWFDQSELRGGDAWDQKIRRQIHDCELFVPVISANTEGRREGYFRREWRLAVDRTHDMSDRVPFLVPVVIDHTSDKGADVPESFANVQWTRLPNGDTPAAFCERIRMLLGGADAPRQPPMGTRPTPSKASIRTPGRWKALTVVGALVVLLGGWQAWRLMHPKSTANAPAMVVAAPGKSIAVLPFVDMSEKKDQEYFSDGLSEELIDQLSHNAELKVIARTSSFAFKGKNEDMRTIAAKLGVANLLEGSVRKAGYELRITAQLIRASDGVHLWSQTYERKLNDIFKLQGEIAGTVAQALKVALNTTAGTTGNHEPNIEAYNLLLKGNYFFKRRNKGDNERAIEMYQQAIALDSRYALAWASLASVYIARDAATEISSALARSEAWDAVHRALAIDPNCAKAHRRLGHIFMVFDWDWSAAKSEFERAVALDPTGEDGLRARSSLLYLRLMRTGRFDALLGVLRQDVVRSPLDTTALFSLAINQTNAEYPKDAVVTWRKLLELNSTFASAQAGYAYNLSRMGKNPEALAAVQRESDDWSRLSTLPCIYWAMGRRPESDAALREFEDKFARIAPASVASVHGCRGETDATFNWLERAYQQRDSGMINLWIDPDIRKFHSDPRFKALLVKMTLAET